MNIAEILFEDFITEMMVPDNISYKKWLKMKNNGETPSKYNEKHPSAKWKIVHCNKKGEVGKAIKGSSGKNYKDALKMHIAIKMNKGS